MRRARSGFSRRWVVEVLEPRALLTSGPSFLSAFGLGATGTSPALHSNAVAVDSAGDSIVTGSFRGTVGFDPLSSGSSLSTGNSENAFVAKYTPMGALSWVKVFVGQATQSGGTTTYATSQGSAVAVDSSGNVFVTGSFSGTLNVAKGSGVATISSPTGSEVMAAKLDGSGNLIWLSTSTGANSGDTDAANALALDGSGGAYIAGSFADSAGFGTTSDLAGGASEAFVAHLSSSGQFLWAVTTHGSGNSIAQASGLVVDGSGNLGVSGWFAGSVGFDSSSPLTTLTSSGSNDGSLWKLNPSGQTLWANRYGSTDFDVADAITVDGSGNFYATGAFSGTVNFGTLSQPDSLTAGPIFNAFVLKVDPNGIEVWTRGYVGSGLSKGQSIVIDSSGVAHVAGEFSGTVNFGPGASANNLTSGGSTDAFASGLDRLGNPTFALQAGRQNSNIALGLAINATGLVVMTGTDTGPIGFGSTTIPAIGQANAFVATYQAILLPVAPSAPILEANSDSGVSSSDGITSVTSPVFDINTAGSTNTIQLLRNGVVVAFRTGPGPIIDPGPLADGTYVYSANQVNSSSQTSPASLGTNVTILTRPPAAPTSAPTLSPLDDSGVVGDRITNVRQPRLTGIVAANQTFKVFASSGLVYGQGTSAADGSYTVKLSTPLADGTYSLAIRSMDLAGNLSASGPALSIQIDGTAPAAPGPLSLFGSDDSGILGDRITNVVQPRLTGLAEPLATVQIVDASLKVYATTIASASGGFTAMIGSVLVDGTYAFQARSVDPAGNIGSVGSSTSITIDTLPPSTPTIPTLLAADDSGLVGDGITNVRQPRLVGSVSPNLTVQLLNSSNVSVGSATANASGGYTVTPSTSLADGTYLLRAVALDVAGNVSRVSLPVTLVILATPPVTPPAPGLLIADDSGGAGDGMTEVRRPRIVGTSTPNGRIDWLSADGSIFLSTAASSTGAYQFQTSMSLANGTYGIRVRATDVAGNVSGISPTFNLTIRVAPGDSFGDGSSDFPTYCPSNNTFYIGRPAAPTYLKAFGYSGDVPITGDFFGLGHADVGVYHPSTSTFTVFDAVTRAYTSVQIGQSGDVPVPGDYDGDGKTDFAVFRATNNTFYVLKSSTNTVLSQAFANAGDIPVPADYFGNGHTDLGIYRPSTSTFYAYDLVTTAGMGVTWGQVGDVPIPADYEGIGRADLAVFRPSTNTFIVRLNGSNIAYSKTFAQTGDIPVPADYFGDGRADLAVFRPSTSTFYACEISGSNYLSKQVGPVGLLKPVLGPITTWYTFGSGPPRPNLVIHPGNPTTSSPQVVTIPSPIKVKLVNQSILTKGLEGGFPLT